MIVNFKRVSSLHFSEKEKFNQMQTLYHHVGRLFEYDGKSIYQLQQSKVAAVEPQRIEEENEFEFSSNANQTHFSSNRTGYQALRQKQNRSQANFVIRERSNRRPSYSANHQYDSADAGTNNLVP